MAAGTEPVRMPTIVRNKAVLHAARLDEPLLAPGPGGEALVIGQPGEWAIYSLDEEEDEPQFVFKGILTEREYREKHRLVT